MDDSHMLFPLVPKDLSWNIQITPHASKKLRCNSQSARSLSKHADFSTTSGPLSTNRFATVHGFDASCKNGRHFWKLEGGDSPTCMRVGRHLSTNREALDFSHLVVNIIPFDHRSIFNAEKNDHHPLCMMTF